MAGEETDPNAHVGAQFREAFDTWAQFRQYVAERTPTAEFNADRALHQILSADFAARLIAANPHEWILFGSLALPVRPLPTDSWPNDLAPAQETGVHPAYVMARSAFDLDLSALDVTHPDPETAAREFGQRMAEAVASVTVAADGSDPERGIGLGGLIRYTADVSIHPTGKLMGVIIAQPIDPTFGTVAPVAVDDPITLEIDMKPPNRVRLFGAPEQAQRSVVALEMPGFAPAMPAIYPAVSQLADKITIISGAPRVSARGIPSGPWHRYKDIFDIYYMIKTSRVDADEMREGIRVNNLAQSGREDLPSPFRAYGQEPPAGEKAIPWHEACEAMRAEHPQLAGYPQFAAMENAVGAFVSGLETAPSGSTWVPGQGWTLHQGGTEHSRSGAVAATSYDAPAQYSSPAEQNEGARRVAEAFVEWSGTGMGQELAQSRHQAVTAFRDAWKNLPPTGETRSARQYGEVARTAAAVANVAASSGRFKPEDLAALRAVSGTAQQHTARLVATHGSAATQPNAAPSPAQQVRPPTAPLPPGIRGRKGPGPGS
ncbi:nucleotidyl transferase AbiEii/AbiGii toxin family protein [Streptomyces sp. NPDC001581]|uniref:nucleotidyl transferase AbiEii/AbiGii toxin family protein n=1 Tax=Streptomyces sp. NPDC001581 TaxID=3154386 RepID=UPI0033277F78